VLIIRSREALGAPVTPVQFAKDQPICGKYQIGCREPAYVERSHKTAFPFLKWPCVGWVRVGIEMAWFYFG